MEACQTLVPVRLKGVDVVVGRWGITLNEGDCPWDLESLGPWLTDDRKPHKR